MQFYKWLKALHLKISELLKDITPGIGKENWEHIRTY